MGDGLPPGPRLPAWAQGVAYATNPVGFVRWCGRRYGDTITMRLPRFGTYVYFSDPEDIRTIFKGDPDVFRAGEANGSALSVILGHSSVLVTDSDQHSRQRRLMSPPFHGEAVRRQTELMAALAATEVDTWPVGEPMQLLPRMRAITLEVILRTVVGTTDGARLAELRSSLPPVVDIRGLLTVLLLIPRLQRGRLWNRFTAARERADAAIHAEIASCRADPDLESRTDVLAMLVRARDEDGSAMSDGELRDQLLTLLLAGHETTATALAWAFERLVRHPTVLAKAQRAAQDGDDEFLDAIIYETLRVRPIITDVVRQLAAPVEIGGYRIPAGIMVSPAIAIVHTSPHAHHDPMNFDPSRWAGRHPDIATWLPFGGGNRRCLGAAFATTEMRVVLRETLRRVDLAPAVSADEQPKLRNVTVVPKQGARVVITRRRESDLPSSDREAIRPS